MLTKKELEIIEEYVDEEFYDKEKLIKYLSIHDVVGNEVFSYCDRQKGGKSTYSSWLDYEAGYDPLPVSTFVKRIPFYFYARDVKDMDVKNMGTLHYLYSTSIVEDENLGNHKIYTALEYAFYSLKLPLNRIFSYWINQTGYVEGNGFFQWIHYLQLCEKLGIEEYFPERFIVAYNEVLEAAGLEPIIYEIDECGLGAPFIRNGTRLEFEGRFPCDSDGSPIMKWIGIKTTNIKSIRCNCEKSKRGNLIIEIMPSTKIHVLNFYNYSDDTEDYWYQVYAGPLTMEFDYKILKKQRKLFNFTQRQVAEAIGTTVRTYQKWESGETTPDGRFLLRLLNWLDISDIQNTIEYNWE
ncbi:MAG: helix-turn-helix transcriptional regulator [Eubacterium sp.]|nr:helix-turn-helix transcriptional regulator [Eubacterium sp.]